MLMTLCKRRYISPCRRSIFGLYLPWWAARRLNASFNS